MASWTEIVVFWAVPNPLVPVATLFQMYDFTCSKQLQEERNGIAQKP